MKYMPIISGRIRHLDLVMSYTQSVLRELNLHRLRTRPIVIEFVTKCGEGEFGYCIGDVDGVEIQVARKNPYTGKPNSFMNMMQTLTHELVHAKQFLRGELKTEGDWVWKGRKSSGYQYDNQPWEKEAYRLEKEIFWKCFPIDVDFRN